MLCAVSLLVSLLVAPQVRVAPAAMSATPLGLPGASGTAARLIWAFHWSVGNWLQGESRVMLFNGSKGSRTVERQSVPSGFCECVSGATGAGLMEPLDRILYARSAPSQMDRDLRALKVARYAICPLPAWTEE